MFSAQSISLFLLVMGRIQKDTEGLVLRAVPEEEFLHKKIKNKDVYVEYGGTEDISEDAWSLRQQ